jgi:hypothetical protein
VGPFKHSGNEDFVAKEGRAADRAEPAAVSFKAVNAAPDVHETVLTAGKRGKGHGFDQLAFVKTGGADRADLGVARSAVRPGVPPAPPARA